MNSPSPDGARAWRAKVLAVAVGACLGAGGCNRAQPKFELVPSVVSSCTQPVATKVIWDVRPLGLKYAEVEVGNLGRVPKTWVSGGATATFEAGAWAHDGYTVTLKAMNGVVLARRTLTTTPCPGKGWL